jgi:hypothetical protein
MPVPSTRAAIGASVAVGVAADVSIGDPPMSSFGPQALIKRIESMMIEDFLNFESTRELYLKASIDCPEVNFSTKTIGIPFLTLTIFIILAGNLSKICSKSLL